MRNLPIAISNNHVSDLTLASGKEINLLLSGAISLLPLERRIALLNEFHADQYCFAVGNGTISFGMIDIKKWAEDADLTFISSDDTPDTPIAYHLNDEYSDISFPDEREALAYAFSVNKLPEILANLDTLRP